MFEEYSPQTMENTTFLLYEVYCQALSLSLSIYLILSLSLRDRDRGDTKITSNKKRNTAGGSKMTSLRNKVKSCSSKKNK